MVTTDSGLHERIKQVLAGDTQAFDDLVLEHQKSAHIYAYSLLRDHHLAQDAVQEAFVAAYQSLAQLQNPSAFPSWFRRIVCKQCDRISRRKSEIPVPPESADAFFARGVTPLDVAESAELRKKISDLIDGLPFHQRDVVRMFYLQELSQAEIGQAKGVPVSTVKNLLRSARSALRGGALNLVASEKLTTSKTRPFPEETTMPKPPKSEVKQVIQGAPIIQVNDPEETAEYYRDVLGFEFDFGSDFYTVVWRDNAAIHFVRSDEPASGVRTFLWVKNADDVLAQFKEKGATVKVDIGNRDYGIRDFTVVDCNGLEIVVGQDID